MKILPADQEQKKIEKRIAETPENVREQEMRNSMAAFHEVCRQIEDFSHMNGFHGGFDEAMSFLRCQAFADDPQRGTYLFSLWQGADKAATYAAGKCGIGQPEWWYKCWQED